MPVCCSRFNYVAAIDSLSLERADPPFPRKKAREFGVYCFLLHKQRKVEDRVLVSLGSSCPKKKQRIWFRIVVEHSNRKRSSHHCHSIVISDMPTLEIEDRPREREDSLSNVLVTEQGRRGLVPGQVRV
ncbi:hypothetical protein MRB53_013991 [Persea americana]|uniref:Uncharacterized protein n=1 Tax=Persea americana TaxID=3435 RepID=A0ACC2K9K5_PERAE|nr:hypothetical protein MRB53_013991 [Persea americana]